MRYRLTLAVLATLLLALPATAAAAPEPTPDGNDDAATAFGPLLGGTLYGGGIDGMGESQSEGDFFYFYTAAAGELDVTVTNMNGGVGVRGILSETGNLDDGSLDRGAAIDEGTAFHLRHAGSGPSRYYVVISGGVDARYELRIDPASLITTTPPSEAAPESGSEPAPRSAPRRKVSPRRIRAKVRRKCADEEGRDRKVCAKEVRALAKCGSKPAARKRRCVRRTRAVARCQSLGGRGKRARRRKAACLKRARSNVGAKRRGASKRRRANRR